MRRTSNDPLEPALGRLIAVILLGGMLGILNSTMVAVGIDLLATEFDTSLSTVGWVSTGFLLAVTVTIPVTGWAVDRFGGKRMWLVGLGLFLCASLASGLAWNVGSLITFRVLQGVGAGILDPLVLTLLARAAGPRRAGRVMGLMAAVLSLGPVLGPLAGGALLQALDWRWLFLANLPLGVLALLLAAVVMPADQPTDVRSGVRLDVIGLALLGPGFAGLLLALTRAAERTEPLVWPLLLPLVAGAALLVAYVVHSLRLRALPPLIDLRLFARGGFAASVTVMALTGLVMFASLFALTLFFQQVHGHDALAVGLLVVPLGVGSAVAAPLAGRVSDRTGSRNPALAGSAVALLGALAFTRVGPHTDELWVVLVSLAIGAGLGFVGPPAMGSLYRALPGPLVPQGSSVLYMLNQLGASVGIAVVAFVLDRTDEAIAGFHGVYWFVAGAALVVLAASALLPGRSAPPTSATPEDTAVSADEEGL